MKHFLSAFVAASTAACATAPANISAAYVSPLQYQSYTCDQIVAENQRVSAKVREVTGQQQAKADSDTGAMAIGMILFWPALFFLASGQDKKEELSRLKGEYDALQQASVQKNCMAQPAPTAAPTATPAA